MAQADQELQQLQSARLDLAIGLADTATVLLKSNPDFTLYSAPTFTGYNLFLDTQRPPLDDKRLRQAIVYAIDTSAIITQVSTATGLPVYPLSGPLPAGIYPYSPDVQQLPFDQAKAKQLLADAGHPGGGFSLRLIYVDQDPTGSALAPLLQQDLAQIGVTLQAQPLGATDLYKQFTAPNPANRQDIFGNARSPFHLDGAVDILLPFHSAATKSFDLSYYNNPAYDQLVDSAFAQEVTNPEAALAQFVQAQKLLVDDAPVVYLFTDSANYVLPNYLKGFSYNPNTGVDFYSIYYDPSK